jgi:hypothetical protein
VIRFPHLPEEPTSGALQGRVRSAERAIHDILAVRTSRVHCAEAKCHEWQFAGRVIGCVVSASREAPRCLPGAGLESDDPVEILARSEAGDDGRLQSRRPGAGVSEQGPLPRPFAMGASAPRLEEAARAGSGGRRRIDHPHSLPRDRTAAGVTEHRPQAVLPPGFSPQLTRQPPPTQILLRSHSSLIRMTAGEALRARSSG